MHIVDYVPHERLRLRAGADEHAFHSGALAPGYVIVPVSILFAAFSAHPEWPEWFRWLVAFLPILIVVAIQKDLYRSIKAFPREVTFDGKEQTISWLASDAEASENIPLSSSICLRISWLETSDYGIRGNLDVAAITKDTKESDKNSLLLPIDWLTTEEDFQDFSHRLARIAGFARYRMDKVVSLKDPASSDLSLTYSADGPLEIPDLSPKLPEYGSGRVAASNPPNSLMDKPAPTDGTPLRIPPQPVGPDPLLALAAGLILFSALVLYLAYLPVVPIKIVDRILAGLIAGLASLLLCGAFVVGLGTKRRGVILDPLSGIIFTGRQPPPSLPIRSIKRVILAGSEVFLDSSEGIIPLGCFGGFLKATAHRRRRWAEESAWKIAQPLNVPCVVLP